MKPKTHYLELPNHPELLDQDKTQYKNVVQWRYSQTDHASFLDRDRVVRSATREVTAKPEIKVRDDLFGALLIVIGLILYFLLGYAFIG